MSSTSDTRLCVFPSGPSQPPDMLKSDTNTNNAPPSTTAPRRPFLSTSLSDFALHASTSSSPFNGDEMSVLQPKDDSAPLIKRMRRPTIIHNWLLGEGRVNSPLSNTFTIPSPRGSKGKERCGGRDDDETTDMNDSDAATRFRDKDRMTTDSSSPSSDSNGSTPPLRFENPRLEEVTERPKPSPMDISRSASPASALKPPADIQEPSISSRTASRRLSCPPRPTRLLTLRAEAAHPEESEIKHEAQFQRLVVSLSGLPPGFGPSRSSRTHSDKGRYPEEATNDDEFQREDTPSDDGEDEDDGPQSSVMLNYKIPSGSEPINITKPGTPAPSILGTPEEHNYLRGVSESPGNFMDVDLPNQVMGSPALTSTSIPPYQWRQTPPPTTSSAVRTAKRKYEDRFDPYAPSAKRRAVSPSISQLKERDIVSPIVIPRSPVLKPRQSFSHSHSQANSATSSPTISHSNSFSYGNGVGNSAGNGYPIQLSGNGHHRSGSSSSVVSSPTVRASMILASPILRPVPRLAKRANGDEEKIVDGAGENLRDLNIGR